MYQRELAFTYRNRVFLELLKLVLARCRRAAGARCTQRDPGVNGGHERFSRFF